jgi:microcystin-dependent protein
VPFAGAAAPTGYLLCDGASVSTTTYADLFAVVAYTYGGAGATFTLPDLRGRTPVGAGTGTGLTARTLGANVGAETVALAATDVPAHGHGAGTLATGNNSVGHTHSGTTGNDSPDHTHSLPNVVAAGGGGSAFSSGSSWTLSTATGGASARHTHAFTTGPISANHTHTITGSTANSTAATTNHANIQPSLVLNYIIKT